MERPVLVLDGMSLTCGDVAAAARGAVQVAVSADGRQRAGAAAEVAAYATARREVYGRTTGVAAASSMTARRA
jgi:histidine ammonia-lyase